MAKITNPPTVRDLIDQDITTPGYIRLPVCGPAEAFKNWNDPQYSNTRYPTFPCNKVE